MRSIWTLNSFEEYEKLNKKHPLFYTILLKDLNEQIIQNYDRIVVLLTEKHNDFVAFHLGRLSQLLDNVVILNFMEKNSSSFLEQHFPSFYYEKEENFTEFCNLLECSADVIHDFLKPILTFQLPKILFITGVPGTGKTTISYQLLKQNSYFKIIEETDIMRDILVGYNQYLMKKQSLNLNTTILDHTYILDMKEMIDQCAKMKNSIQEVVKRQIRKNIPTIINGVHLIPEILDKVLKKEDIVYLQLYVNNKETLKNRIITRDPNSHMVLKQEDIFITNQELKRMFTKIRQEDEKRYFSIDVTEKTVEEVVEEVFSILKNR